MTKRWEPEELTQPLDPTGVVTLDGRHRYWHTDPKTGLKTQLPSFSKIKDLLDVGKSNALAYWNGNGTSQFMLDQILLRGRKHEDDPYLEIDVDRLGKIREEAKSWNKRTKEEAGDIGTQVHSAIEVYLTTGSAWNPVVETLTDQEQIAYRGFRGFVDWVNPRDFSLIESEFIAWSAKYRYACRIDLIGWMGGLRTLPDIKTTNGIYLEHILQGAAYANAYEETVTRVVVPRNWRGIESVGVIRIDKETGQVETAFDEELFDRISADKNLAPLTRDKAFEIFLSLRNICGILYGI